MSSKRFQARHGLDNNNQTITRVAAPVNDTDAVNKQYADSIGATATNAIPLSQKGVANGVATLDAEGFIPTGQLPSYVDEVLEYPTVNDFPIPGQTNKIYVALDVHKIYRWGGSNYIDVSASAGTADEAVKLATARNIALSGDVTGSTSFDGSQNVTIVSTLKDSGVVAGTYPKVTVDSSGVVTSGESLEATDIPVLDASKITSGTLTVNTSGNAATATKLATARTINGVDFDGTENITVADATKLPLTGGTITGTSLVINPLSGNANLSIGGTRGVSTTPVINFHSGETATTYDAKIVSTGGNGTDGNGVLQYEALRHEFAGDIKSSTTATSSAASHYFVETGSDGVLRPKTLANVRSEVCPEIQDDTSTDLTCYPVFATQTSGNITNAKVASTKLTFNPSTGDLGATNFNSLSDARYKENITPISNALDKVMVINGYSYDWKDGSGASYGVIAQELHGILPNAVSINAEGRYSVNYNSIVPFLIEAIKEQQKQIEELRNKQ